MYIPKYVITIVVTIGIKTWVDSEGRSKSGGVYHPSLPKGIHSFVAHLLTLLYWRVKSFISHFWFSIRHASNLLCVHTEIDLVSIQGWEQQRTSFAHSLHTVLTKNPKTSRQSTVIRSGIRLQSFPFDSRWKTNMVANTDFYWSPAFPISSTIPILPDFFTGNAIWLKLRKKRGRKPSATSAARR